jgi:protein SCO1
MKFISHGARNVASRRIYLCAISFVACLGACPHASPGQSVPKEISLKAGLEQRLNVQVPLDLIFRDETGQAARLGNYFGAKPVILALGYYECPNMCTLVFNALLSCVQDLKLDAGKDFEIVIVSFNAGETSSLAAARKQTYTQRYGRPDGARGWHFLTGNEPAVRQLAERVGYYYVFDPQTKQYAHPSAIIVLTPAGKVSRYFAGIEYPPKELALALSEASNGRIGSLTHQLFLLCFHYNPLVGKYGLLIVRIIRVAGVATVAALVIFMVTMFRRDRGQLKTTGSG